MGDTPVFPQGRQWAGANEPAVSTSDLSPMERQRCTTCGGAGWTLDGAIDKEPVALDLLPCPIPDCLQSGRVVTTLSLPPGRFTKVTPYPGEGYLMALQAGSAPLSDPLLAIAFAPDDPRTSRG